MIKKILFVLLAIVLFSACHKTGQSPDEKNDKVVICIPGDPYDYLDQYSVGSVCTSDTCKKYEAIWKALFTEKNNLTDSFFNVHIKLMKSAISSGDDGISFSICYRMYTDWAIAYSCDQFIINITDSAKNQVKDLPRDEYLSADQVKEVVNQKAYGSTILHLSDSATLKFSSMQDALQDLTRASLVNTLCIRRVYINDAGHLALEAGAQYANKNNVCITASLDLITGISTKADGPCWVN